MATTRAPPAATLRTTENNEESEHSDNLKQEAFWGPTTTQAYSLDESCRIRAMAKSKFEYVKQYESRDELLPNCWLVVRLDGKAFHRFSSEHGFAKPNDERSLRLMTSAAVAVLTDATFAADVVLAYGHSDEYSFVIRRQAQLFNRRAMKIVTNLCSAFTAQFVFRWRHFFPDVDLKYPPTFDGRAVLYPTDQNLRDYLSWRQADCHINNLYNTVFWALVLRGGLSTTDAERRLRGTYAKDKHEILFSQFGINYNDEAQMYRKGTVLFQSKSAHTKDSLEEAICERHVDIIGDEFWRSHPEIIDTIIHTSSLF